MFILLSVMCICATVIWFAKNYIQPYTPPKQRNPINNTIDEDECGEQANFDDIIAEIYGRLDDEE